MERTVQYAAIVIGAAITAAFGCGPPEDGETGGTGGTGDETPEDPCEADSRCDYVDGVPTCSPAYEWVGSSCVRVVAYNMFCDDVSCSGPSDTSSFDGGSYQSFTCTWFCIRFEGRPRRYVSITFERTSAAPCWAVGSTYQTSGICD